VLIPTGVQYLITTRLQISHCFLFKTINAQTL